MPGYVLLLTLADRCGLASSLAANLDGRWLYVFVPLAFGLAYLTGLSMMGIANLFAYFWYRRELGRGIDYPVTETREEFMERFVFFANDGAKLERHRERLVVLKQASYVSVIAVILVALLRHSAAWSEDVARWVVCGVAWLLVIGLWVEFIKLRDVQAAFEKKARGRRS